MANQGTFVLVALILTVGSLKMMDCSTATIDWFYSYAPCCPKNPNYDAKMNYSAICDPKEDCKAAGNFIVLGHVSLDYVKANNLVTFYDSTDPNGNKFMTKYGGKNISLTIGDKNFTARIADTCLDVDCDGCCTEAAKPHGFALELEYYTAVKHFGSVEALTNITATWNLL